MSDDDPLGDIIVERLQRATLPLKCPAESGTAGTAFFYNHLVEPDPDGDTVIELLITADALVDAAYGELLIRGDMVHPPGAASDVLLMGNFDRQWVRGTPPGVAFMGSDGLHEHGRRKRWSWVLQQVTDGFAAKEDDVAAVGTQSELGYILGHGVQGRDRPLMLVRGSIARDAASATITWMAEVPEGLTGAPVFSTRLVGGGGIKIVCLGVLQPGNQSPRIATFDTIRRAITDTLGSAPA